MTEPRITAKPAAPAGPAPAARPAPAGDTPPAGRERDRVETGPIARPAIEADVRIAMAGGTAAAADGTVRVQRRFIERFIEKTMVDRTHFPALQVRWDAAANAYAIVGKARWHGLPVPTIVHARPVMAGGRPGLAFDAPALRIGGLRVPAPFLAGTATALVLDRLRSTSLRAQAAGPGTITFDPASVLHATGAMPDYLTLDMRKTAIALATGPDGEVTIGLTAAGVPKAAAATPRSDVAIRLDDEALEAVLRRAAGADYEVKALRLREDGAKVTGQANARPVSDTLTFAKTLLVLAAIRNGQAASSLDTDAVVVKTDLDLDLRVDGRIVTIAPSIGLACDEMLKTLTAMGVPATKAGRTLRIDVDAAAKVLHADVRALSVGERGVALELGLDLDALIRDPALVRE